MKMKSVVLVVILSVFSAGTYALTWNEPWQETIIQEAESFILAKVVSFDEHDGLNLELIKSLGGKELPQRINVTNFYLLQICSSTNGHDPEFHFDGIDTGYFFIKKNKQNEYCISTPSSGYAIVRGENVIATYRHSYHYTLLPASDYETTMTTIFKFYHNQEYDLASIKGFIDEQIHAGPTEPSKRTNESFAAKHAALETIYHLQLPGYFTEINEFLIDSTNFHHQVSAARSMSAYNSKESKDALLTIISDKTAHDFLKVICIWSLQRIEPSELKPQLVEIEKTASTEQNGFGGRLMDPRICTYFPDVKTALNNLIEKL
jgi:hypothetical protein